MPIEDQSDSLFSYDLISDVKLLKFENPNPDLPNENARVLCILDDDDSINQIINCSLVLGLNITEGILVIGHKKLYFISDLHYDSTRKEVLNLDKVSKSMRDINIELITGQSNSSNNFVEKKNILLSWALYDITYTIKKPFLLRDLGLEIMFESKASYFFSFADKKCRNLAHQSISSYINLSGVDPILVKVVDQLSQYGNQIGTWNGITKANLSTKFSNIINSKLFLADDFDTTNLWRSGKISNFYYLMIINSLAGRSFNDVTQYPIFPWVIADYKSEVLDLDNPKTYRDLSKPMGAQSEKRMGQFIERYEAMESLNDDKVKPFHYGTHYSSAMIVSSFLVRLKPFTESFLLLQGGQFGHADRLFNSVERTWLSASQENTTDVRELIPEFYFLPEFLLNLNDYDFGEDQNGHTVSDVILPPWANNDPQIFIRKNREALESKYVTEHLNEWIDLIFGFKQRGEMAIKSCNVFNQLSYPGAVNLDNINDENERRIVTSIIHNFGQIPLQIFQAPHPHRQYDKKKNNINPNRVNNLKLSKTVTNKVNEKISFLQEIWNPDEKDDVWHGYKFLDIELPNKQMGNLRIKQTTSRGLDINGTEFQNLHESPISCFCAWKDNMFITGDTDGLIKVWILSKLDISTIILKEVTSLNCHLDSILQIEKCQENNIIVSLDMSGCVYSWDMTTYQMIRCFTDSEGKYITISPHSGIIGIVMSKTSSLNFYTLNGLLIHNEYSYSNSKQDTNITVLQSIEVIPRAKHQYLQDGDYFITVYSDNVINMHQLLLDGERWKIDTFKMKLHSDENKAGQVQLTNQVSCVKGFLVQQDSQSFWKLEVILGYFNGTVQTYTSV